MTGMANSPGHPAGRGAVGLAVLAAHLLLVAWLARTTWQHPQPVVVATPLSVSIIQPTLPQPSAAPLPAPRLMPIQTAAIVPEVTVRLPSPAAITAQVAAPRPAAAPAAPVASPAPVVISEVAYLRQPQPRYPALSRRAHEEGLVVVQVLIDIQGRAQRVTVVRSSGHPRLDAAACEAVSRALFKPLLTNGMPHTALATVPVEFSLHPV